MNTSNTSRDILFQPITIQQRILKNRFVVAPMTRRSASSTGVPTEEMAEYYAAFASGGFGLIVTEGTYTDDLFSKTDDHQPGLVNQEQLEGWRKVVERVHNVHNVHYIHNAADTHHNGNGSSNNTGALILLQLMHGGALSQHTDKTIAPSAIQPRGLRNTEAGGLKGPFPLPAAMTGEDLLAAKNGYVQTALRAVSAGFDGVEIHAANGYLPDQFITPHTNVREDEYGGSVTNRLRFLMEIYRAIKAVVPDNFIVGIRLSESKVNDLSYRWPEGPAMASAIFETLKELDASYIHIAAEGGNWARESLYDDGQSSNGIAKRITAKPVIVNGGMHDTDLAVSLLADQQADLVSIGRAAIANPDLPKRIANGIPVTPFSKELIKDSLTLSHTRRMLGKMQGEIV